MTKPAKVSGSVQARKTKSGKKFYGRIRVNGREYTRLMGPAWNGAASPRSGTTR